MTQISDPILVGVDGGGTGCRVAVGTLADGILAEARGGRSNISTDFDVTIASVTAAAHEALASAGFTAADLPRCVAHLGLAGYTGPELDAPARAALPFGRSIVSEDTLTTVVGAIGPQDGYVIALGTGTIIARQKAGQQDYIGGWCFQVSDQASGARLGRAVLQSTLLHVDGILPASNLTQHILDKLNGAAGIVQFALRALPGDFATLAPDVVQAAKAGDALGEDLMREGAAYLEAALNALDYHEGDLLCLAGGVGPHYAEFLPPAMTRNMVEPAGRGLDGAFELAGRASLDHG